ncbi:glycosyltransferase family 9 protein [Paraburkholderia silvatlantica]|uniref:ADP-heptose:LPS heptosyltransferase n=1 Tax=Paraburkholderia silvatlantica TaxID=321895 RepID=A0ABR6FZ50_9BURK|nr:glycosyltransferase family 9 protein [Paraburkholderia silvatlantica]MBB2932701.1 ADP-heptose:LPS heptosyltransferase [Paraburkholderia silvatlantica]
MNKIHEALAISPQTAVAANTALAQGVETDFGLGTIAYENIHAPVFHAWLKMGRENRRHALRDRYVFYSYTSCVGAHVTELMRHDFTEGDAFVADVLENISYLVDARISFTEEWFKGLEQLVGDFTTMNFLPEARTLVAVGMNTGVKKFPRLAQSLSVHAAYLDALAGRVDDACAVALRLIQRPYLLPSRRELPAFCHRLVYILAAGNRLREYRLVLWTGLALRQTSGQLRDSFAAQIAKTYRGVFRALALNGDVPLKYRMLILPSYTASLIASVPPLRSIGLHKPFRLLGSAVSLLSERFLIKKSELFRPAGAAARTREEARALKQADAKQRRILVTRAMGGIGDLFMMTPGLLALKQKYPQASIDFAIPKSFHAVFEGLPGIRLINIDEDAIEIRKYKRWVNLTDCPAGKLESKQYPNVRQNRIEIFARSMGISKARLSRAHGFLPFYRVRESEREWAQRYLQKINPDGRPVIGVQPFAADSYRNWPHMEKLVEELSHSYCVLVFHHEPLNGFRFDNVTTVVEPLRNSIALASLCERLVVLDSSFLHIAAALKVPTIAIFGAISGRLRTKDYPNIQLLAPSKAEFPCYPCWRHEHKPCHLTNGRESICLRAISVDSVVSGLKKDLTQWRELPSTGNKVVTWMRFGGE